MFLSSRRSIDGVNGFGFVPTCMVPQAPQHFKPFEIQATLNKTASPTTAALFYASLLQAIDRWREGVWLCAYRYGASSSSTLQSTLNKTASRSTAALFHVSLLQAVDR